MKKELRVRGVIGLKGLLNDRGGFDINQDRIFNINQDRIFNIKIPRRFGKRDLDRMRRDLEILAETLRKHPRQVKALLEARTLNKAVTAKKIAQELELTEEKFQAKGGGIIWGVVLVVLAIDLFLDFTDQLCPGC